MDFKNQLIKIRKRNNLTQSDLASKMNVKQYVISSWEIGRSEPSIEQLIELSKIFNVSIDYLIGNPIIEASSIEEFDNVILNFQKDNNDELFNDILKLCNDMPEKKKKKMLDIVKETLELIK